MSRSSSTTKSELASRVTEAATAAGSLAKSTSRASDSPALQSTVAGFCDHDQTIESTYEMLQRVSAGISGIHEALDDISRSLDDDAMR